MTHTEDVDVKLGSCQDYNTNKNVGIDCKKIKTQFPHTANIKWIEMMGVGFASLFMFVQDFVHNDIIVKIV